MALPKVSVWRIVVLVFGGSVVGAASAFFKLPVWVVTFFQTVILGPTKEPLQPSLLGDFVIIGGTIGLLYLITFLVSRYRYLKARTGVLEGATELYDALSNHGAPVKISDVIWTIDIKKDYSLTVVYEFTWEATSQDVFAWGNERGSPNVSASDLEVVRFQASVLNGPGTILTVPTADEPNQKRYLMFPHPPLKPGGGAQRVRISSNWPKAAKKLKQVDTWDRNAWTIPIRCASPIDSVRVIVNLPQDGKRYETSAASAGSVEERHETHTWSGTFKNVQPGTEIAIRTRRCADTQVGS